MGHFSAGSRFTPSAQCFCVALAVALGLLAACQTDADRKAAENARIQEQASKEIHRICALPGEQREAELKRLKEQSGMVLDCGDQ